MRFDELLEKRAPEGSYVCGKFDKDTTDILAEYQELHHIPNPLDANELHVTIVYSRATIYWRAEHDLCNVAHPIGFEVWDTKDEKKCLVLKIESDYLRTRFDLATARGATYDFDEYKPHITLSYDVGDDFDVSDLPVPEFEIIIDREEYEPLNPEYTA